MCGENGHYARWCTNPQDITPVPFNLGTTAEEAQNASDVVLGTFPVSSVSVFVLFDSGASHSFVSTTFVKKRDGTYPYKPHPKIEYPGSYYLHKQRLQDVQIILGEVQLIASLIVLAQSLDVILRMDWLSKYQAILDCERKRASITSTQGYTVEFGKIVRKKSQVFSIPAVSFHGWLPKTAAGYDSVWVIVDRLTKVGHFIPVKATYAGDKLAELYMKNVVRLHGVPKRIVSDRGSQFTSRFSHKLHEEMGAHLAFSTTYHPQTDGQTERLNQVLEDMLRACALTHGKSWDQSLPYAEFSYNNSFQASLKMSPFEALYGRPCRTPLNWTETGERLFFGTDTIQEAEEQVRVIREKLSAAQSRQKGYADKGRRDLEFQVEDMVYLKVTPLMGVKRFQAKGKLAPRYIGPLK